jgi:hypothetical protein
MNIVSSGPNGMQMYSYADLIAQYQTRELEYKLAANPERKIEIENELKEINSQLKFLDNATQRRTS